MPGARARVPATARGPKRLLSPLRPTARLSERGRCGGRRQPCGQRGGEARRGVGGGGGPVPRPGRHGFRFRLPLSRPFLVPCRLSPKSRGAAVPASALPLPPPPPRLRTAPGRGRRGAAGRRPPHAPSGWSVGRVGERGSQSLTREVGGEVRQLAPKESGGSGTAVQ